MHIRKWGEPVFGIYFCGKKEPPKKNIYTRQYFIGRTFTLYKRWTSKKKKKEDRFELNVDLFR